MGKPVEIKRKGRDGCCCRSERGSVIDGRVVEGSYEGGNRRKRGIACGRGVKEEE